MHPWSSARGCAAKTRKAGRIAARAIALEELVKSAFDGVDALSVALEGPNLQAQLLLQLATDETPYAVSLPSRRAHNGLQRGPFGLLQQRDYFRHLGVVSPCRSCAAVGLVPRTYLLRRHTPPLCASVGLQVLNGLPDPSRGTLPAGEPLHWFHPRQAVPDLHQP